MRYYVNSFHCIGSPICVTIRSDCEIYEMNDARFECFKNMNESNIRGRRAHIVAVEEELTWDENWDKIKDQLKCTCMSPLDIQVFDSVSLQDVINKEREQAAYECYM